MGILNLNSAASDPDAPEKRRWIIAIVVVVVLLAAIAWWLATPHMVTVP